MQRAENISAIILAAGLSSRMKTNKTELPFDSNRNFLQKISEEYLNFTCKEIIVVFNTENYNSYIDKGLKFNDQIKIVINKYPEKGRFYSLKTGISALSEIVFSYIQNIDNPFVNQDILNLLNSNSEKADYIIPSFKGKGGHPILVSEKIIQAVKNTNSDDVNLKTFLNQFEKYYAATNDKKILANINTFSDYHLYF